MVITGVFINANNLQKNTASFQRLQNNGSYMMEKIAKEIRAREIDYTATFGTNPLTALYFQPDEYGLSIGIIFDATVNRDGKTIGSIIYSNNQGADFLNSRDIEVVEAKFLVFPALDEIWGAEPVTNLQTRATILLKIKNANMAERYQKTLTLQTTVSGKIYKRWNNNKE